MSIAWKTLALSDALVTARLAERRPIMISAASRVTTWTHYKARRDRHGWYVRLGNRGRSYLTGCELIVIDGKPSVFRFTASNDRL